MEYYAAYAASTAPIPNIYFNHNSNNTKNRSSHRRSKSSSTNNSSSPPPSPDPTSPAASKPSRTSSSSEFSCSSTEKPPGTRSRKSLSFRHRSHHTSTTTATTRHPLPPAAPASGASELGAAMPSQAPPHVSTTPISKHRHISSKPPQVPLPSALLQLALPDTLQLEAPAQNTNTHTPGAANPSYPVPPPPPKASSCSSSSATNPLNTTAPLPPPKDHPPPTPRKNTHHAAMLTEPGNLASKAASFSSNRPESLSSPSGTTLYSRTMQSTSDHNLTTTSSSVDDLGAAAKNRKKKHEYPFVVRNGRTYLQDPTLPYPLPVDLPELHRQNLRTLLLCQLFGGPVCSPAFASSPPSHVLEVGCGSGFWSMMCHRYFAGKGHPNISFTGIDLAPLCPAPPSPSSPSSSSSISGAGTGAGSSTSGGPNATAAVAGPDKDMHWRFVMHDIRRMPFPFADGEFDLIMLKDLSLAVPTTSSQELMEEYLRLLRPGGVLEIWESDHTVRMLRPHVPPTSTPDTEPEDHDHAASLGAYLMTANTPLSAPLNTFLVEYDAWITRALNARSISTVPCTMMGPILLQESETLVEIRSRRLAVPLSEMRWEREGVGGVVTKDGQTYISSKTSKAVREAEQGGGGRRAPLSAGQLALRRTALLTVVQGILALEPILRETAGKSLDEWDVWTGKMMADLMGGGTSWGECLEVGAWWGKKRG